jgi:N-acetyl-gamma-glutamyl-phosphate reductase
MIKTGIIGVSGFTGLELVKILINHPKFNITYVANSSGEQKLTQIHPSLQNVFECNIEKTDIDDITKNCELVFLALPHKTSQIIVKELISKNIKVVDLSADYRLELDNYEEFYCPHIDKENLNHSVYGLPEIYKKDIMNSKLIANPGCYPTATILGILPFLDYIDNNTSIFIDAKSGVSGAGKKLNEVTTYMNINENIFAYNPLKHRHSIEIKEKLEKVSSKNFDINFVPTLIPISRGMLINTFIKINKANIDAISILKEYYKDEKFIRIKDTPVDVKSVSGTNFCDIFVDTKDDTIFINTSIDNLLRGASSQAVVNANIMYGFDEDLGINSIAYTP